MSGRVFQLVPVLEPGDAMGNHALRIARALGERHGGFIVERAAPELRGAAVRWSEARVDPGDICLYHAGLASQVGDWLRRVRARKAVDYHNITPPGFFRAYDPGLSVALRNARVELEALRPQVALAVAHSEYSRAELEAMGFARTATVPVLVDLDAYDRPGDVRLAAELGAGKGGRGDVLFVGRLAPNKRQEDVIKAFAVYRRLYNPSARLFLVGGSNASTYEAALGRFVGRLGVEEVHLCGRATHEQLLAYYATADVFLSMSEHEGFGVPLVEAMHLGVPVVAFAAAAVPETVGGAGVLLSEKRYDEVAALLDLVMRDDALRARMAAAGRARAAALRPERHEARLVQLLDAI